MRLAPNSSADSAPPAARRSARRTQAERRARTRAALLDGALACLVEEGYASLTTRHVAQRAGVSQGTLMHYFPTRERFLAEAVHHLAVRLRGELRPRAAGRARPERRRLEELLEQVWQFHLTPAFQATFELWVAARTDPPLRDAMNEVVGDISRLIADAAAELLPRLMATPRAGELLDLTLATVRGLALLESASDAGDVERRWHRARNHLLALYDRL
jgi:AcrR family transcriptional regulator